MVRASMRAGLRKEAILDVVRAIQDGTPDFDCTTFKHEEQQWDQGAGEDEEDETHDSQQVEGVLAGKEVRASSASHTHAFL